MEKNFNLHFRFIFLRSLRRVTKWKSSILPAETLRGATYSWSRVCCRGFPDVRTRGTSVFEEYPLPSARYVRDAERWNNSSTSARSREDACAKKVPCNCGGKILVTTSRARNEFWKRKAGDEVIFGKKYRCESRRRGMKKISRKRRHVVKKCLERRRVIWKFFWRWSRAI